MPKDSPYHVPLSDLDKVHVAVEDQVEEHDVTPPVPDAKSDDERSRETVLRYGAAGV